MNTVNLINRENSLKETPTTGENWVNKSDFERLELVSSKLSISEKYKKYQPIKAPKNGHLILITDSIIDAATRGQLLLEIEEYLKAEIDEGLVVWLEPVGDKSKLRGLRGIQVKY